MDQLNELVTRQLDSMVESLATTEPGSKERSDTVSEIVQLYRVKIEDEKTKADISQKERELDIERDRLAAETQQKRNEAIVTHIINGAGIVLPLIVGTCFYGFWYKRWFIFETEGTYTSGTGRRIDNGAAKFFKI